MGQDLSAVELGTAFLVLMDAAASCNDQIWVAGFRMEQSTFLGRIWRYEADGTPTSRAHGQAPKEIEFIRALAPSSDCSGLVLSNYRGPPLPDTPPGSDAVPTTVHVARVR